MNTLSEKARNVRKTVAKLAAINSARAAAGIRVRLGRKIRIAKGDKCILLSSQQAVYLGDMVRHFDFYFDAVVPERVGRQFVADYSQARWHQLADGTRFYFPSLPEPVDTTDLYLESGQLYPGAVVLDVGAYAGASTYAFARAVGPEGHVYAFEPDPASFEALRLNVEHHGLTNVTILPVGIWNETGTVAFECEASLGSGISAVQGRGAKTRQVEVWTMDEVVARLGIEAIHFIKLDIEGAEVPVLRHAVELLRRFAPRLVVEAHKAGEALNTPEICSILERAGYTCRLMEQPPLQVPLVHAVPAGQG